MSAGEMRAGPTFTLVVPAATATPGALRATVSSVVRQTHRDWRLVVADADAAVPGDDRISSRADASHPWALAAEEAGDDGLVAVIAPGDALRPDALAAVAGALGGAIDIVYTDEHVRHADGSWEPWLKPGWSPERARSQDYCGQLTVFRGRTLAGLADAGGTADRHAVLLHACRRARGVTHVPRVLFDRTSPVPPPVPRAYDRPAGSASVVIPTAGTARPVWGVTRPLVLTAVDSVLAVTEPAPQVVVVVDPSTPAEVLDALGERDVTLVAGERPFNFAAACNAGVAASDGDDVVLLNDDTLVEDPAWLSAMRSFFVERDVGVVGARLLYADGTLQHAGVLLNGQPLHIFHGHGGADPGPFDLLRVNREVSAVTGACLATPRIVWDRLGGLDTTFAVAGNDLDYCLRVRRAGYRVIWTPDATLYHFESQSRRHDLTPADTAMLYERWRTEMFADPYGNPNFEPRQAEWIERQPLALEQRAWRGMRRLLRRPEPSDAGPT